MPVFFFSIDAKKSRLDASSVESSEDPDAVITWIKLVATCLPKYCLSHAQTSKTPSERALEAIEGLGLDDDALLKVTLLDVDLPVHSLRFCLLISAPV